MPGSAGADSWWYSSLITCWSMQVSSGLTKKCNLGIPGRARTSFDPWSWVMYFPVYPTAHLFRVHSSWAHAQGQEGGGRGEDMPGTELWAGEGEVGWYVEQMQGTVIISAHGKQESCSHGDEISWFCTGASSKDTSALFPTWSDSLKLGNCIPCF